jgi:RNA polymerase sigma-70 factor (ECF subfamily)
VPPLDVDDALVERALRGDDEAFAHLVRRHQDGVVSFLAGMLPDRDRAIDLAQEAFVRLHRHLARYRPEGKLRTYLLTIAANAARDFLKARRREGIVYLSDYRDLLESRARTPHRAEEAPPTATVEAQDRALLVRQALAQVSAAFREALLLRDTEGLPYEEIARALRCSVGTAKSRVSRGREAFREAFGRIARRGGVSEREWA